jgi:hypothetical protein
MVRMTNRFLLRAAAKPAPKIRNEPKEAHRGNARSGGMTHNGRPLNRCQKLRNEPKVAGRLNRTGAPKLRNEPKAVHRGVPEAAR